MALHRALIEMLKISGSMFILFCIASAIGMFLLVLLMVSIIKSFGRRSAFAQ